MPLPGVQANRFTMRSECQHRFWGADGRRLQRPAPPPHRHRHQPRGEEEGGGGFGDESDVVEPHTKGDRVGQRHSGDQAAARHSEAEEIKDSSIGQTDNSAAQWGST